MEQARRVKHASSAKLVNEFQRRGDDVARAVQKLGLLGLRIRQVRGNRTGSRRSELSGLRVRLRERRDNQFGNEAQTVERRLADLLIFSSGVAKESTGNGRNVGKGCGASEFNEVAVSSQRNLLVASVIVVDKRGQNGKELGLEERNEQRTAGAEESLQGSDALLSEELLGLVLSFKHFLLLVLFLSLLDQQILRRWIDP